MKNTELKVNIELIARAICQHGKCEKCDADCIDYRAAERVMAVLEREATTNEAHWIVAGAFDDFLKCSNCGESWPWATAADFLFCPHCGKLMIKPD